MVGSKDVRSLRGLGILGILGPGLAMAAAGVGAGDVTTPALGAAQFGLALIWAPLFAGILKYALNEGLARWQLATGETLLEGWAQRLGPLVSYAFLVYLVVWSVPLMGALASTSGVTMNLFLPLATLDPVFAKPIVVDGPILGNLTWTMILIVAATSLVWLGKYQLFETIMSVMTVLMVVVVATSACILFPGSALLEQCYNGPWFPTGSRAIVFAIMGGTGSTVGVLAYSYWMRERAREGPQWLAITRIDLTCCYVISGFFGVAITLLVGGVSRTEFASILNLPLDQVPQSPRLDQVFQVVAHRLEHEAGLGRAAWLFQLALAATTTSSLLGMLQSVPYFYTDLFALLARAEPDVRRRMTRSSSRWYRTILLAIAVLPLPLVAWKQPREILILYAVWGSLFMPFLAATLLLMNTRRNWVGQLTNGWLANTAILICLAVFAWGAGNVLYEAIWTDSS